jgi:hypothetical protein
MTITPPAEPNVVVEPAQPVVVVPPAPVQVVSFVLPQNVVQPIASPVVEVVSKGIQGPPGQSGGFYTHEQAVASDTWVIPHFLGYFPAVTVIDSAGDEVEGAITYTNQNTVTITFSAPFTGTAYLS